MKPSPLARAALVGAMFVLSAPALAQQAPAAKGDEDPVVARVNGEEIHHSQVMAARLALRGPQRRRPLKEIYPIVLDRLVDERLAAQAAKRNKLEAEAEVRKRIETARDRVLAQAYWRQAVDARKNEDRLRATYKTFLDAFKPEDEIKARHILLKSEKEAKAVIAELKKGADFAELAKAKSTGPSKDRGGDLGYFTRRRMVREFAKAAFSLESGQFTETPVNTGYGWHVIKVEDRRKSAPPSFEAKRAQLAAQLARADFNEVRAELRKAAKIERFDPPIAAAKESGAKPGAAKAGTAKKK